ncbi:MAG: hypothetical protein ACI97A_001448 [Planctomycetota bacterium]
MPTARCAYAPSRSLDLDNKTPPCPVPLLAPTSRGFLLPLLSDSWHFLPIGKLTNSGFIGKVPDNLFFHNEKDTWHLANISAFGPTHPVLLEESSKGVEEAGDAKHLAQATLNEGEMAVEFALWIGDRRGFRPERIYRFFANRDGTLMNEEDPRKLEVLRNDLTKVSDRFTTKQSAEVT